jgi:hypothetical protein
MNGVSVRSSKTLDLSFVGVNFLLMDFIFGMMQNKISKPFGSISK